MKKTLFKNLHILIFNKRFDEIKDGAILVEGNRIVDIGLTNLLRNKHQNVKSIDCKGMVAMPGLINSHTHLPMSFLKGLGHSDPEIIYSVMFPAERNLKSFDLETITAAGAIEAIKAGCTTVVDHYYFANEIAKTMKKIGLRSFLGHTSMGLMGPHTGDREFKAAYKFIEDYSGDDLITPVLAPHAPDTVSKDRLREMLKLSQKKGLLLHLHVAQTEREFNTIRKKYRKTPVEFLESIGFLSDNVLAAHLIHINDNDIKILARRKVNYLCSPVSQLFFEYLAPIEKLWKAGLNFTLATDCVASNDGHNLFHEGRVFNLVMIDRFKNPLVLEAREVLALATRNAAKALKVEDKLGSLEKGKLADFLILDLSRTTRTKPIHNIYNNILYAFSESDINMVVINGEIVLKQGKVMHIDEASVIRKLKNKTKDILNRKK